jgi:hypothetical protein
MATGHNRVRDIMVIQTGDGFVGTVLCSCGKTLSTDSRTTEFDAQVGANDLIGIHRFDESS